LTVSERVHPIAFEKLAKQLPNTIIAPVDPLTDLTDKEFKRRGEKDRATATNHFFKRIHELNTKGLICAAKDIAEMPKNLRKNTLKICPGNRPDWTIVPGDTNAVNAMTHQDAIRAGADILVIGSPLRYNNDLRGNTLRVLDEIGGLLEGECG
jgi:orotidine-5'-phosphate decarboxylase